MMSNGTNNAIWVPAIVRQVGSQSLRYVPSSYADNLYGSSATPSVRPRGTLEQPAATPGATAAAAAAAPARAGAHWIGSLSLYQPDYQIPSYQPIHVIPSARYSDPALSYAHQQGQQLTVQRARLATPHSGNVLWRWPDGWVRPEAVARPPSSQGRNSARATSGPPVACGRTATRDVRYRSSAGGQRSGASADAEAQSSTTTTATTTTTSINAAAHPLTTSTYQRSPPGEPAGATTIDNELACPVCLEVYSALLQQNIRAVVLTRCCHVLCQRCIELVLNQNSSCPKCRDVMDFADPYHLLYF